MAVGRLPVGIERASSRGCVRNQGLHCRICHRNVRSPDWNGRSDAGRGTRRTRRKTFNRTQVTEIKYVHDILTVSFNKRTSWIKRRRRKKRKKTDWPTYSVSFCVSRNSLTSNFILVIFLPTYIYMWNYTYRHIIRGYILLPTKLYMASDLHD